MREPLLLLATAALSLPATAQTQVVFTEYKFNDPKLEVMNLDGSGLANLFAPATPFPISDWLPIGVAIDAGANQLYWCHGSFNAGVIRRANLDGSGQVTLVTGLKNARGLALDVAGGKMYWSNSPAAGNAGGLIERANLDGTGREVVYAITPYDPSFSKIGRPTVDSVNGWVWFGADNSILRVNTSGPPFVARTMITGLSTPTRVEVDAANGWVYGIDSDTISDCVWRARYDDTEFAVVVDSTAGSVESSGLLDLALDRTNGRLYIADEIGNDVIQRANLDGSGLQTIFTSLAGWSPSALTFDTSPNQVIEDCNNNLVRDFDDIDSGSSADCDLDGVPDECQGGNPCATQPNLLLQPASFAGPARALGGTSPGTGWIVFQPFDVPAGGWQVGEISFDGYTTNYDVAGFQATVLPDTGSNYPDESTPLASDDARFRFSHREVSVVFVVSLPPGRHWVRLNGNGIYTGGVHTATSGLPSFSRSNLGNDFMGQPPIALRVREARRFTNFCAGDTTAGSCPCLNFGATFRGCANSFPTFGALLSGDGLASVAADSALLTSSGMPTSASVLFFQGTSQQNGGLGSPFGDGLRCVGGSVVRLGTKTASSGAASYPAVGDASISVRGLLPPTGGLRYYQAWYRNPAAFCTASTFNLTNGLQIAWGI
jgi:hypothetical protein